MHFILTPLLPLTLTLYRLRADVVPRATQLNFSDLPPEINNIIFGHTDLVAYVTALGTPRGAPLVTPEVELNLLRGAAEEVKPLDIYNDNQRARLSLILQATRTIVRLRSALPTTINPDTHSNTLKDLAAQFEITFLEHASLSSSHTWSKHCMATLLGKDTLIKLLPFLSEGFADSCKGLMFDAAIILGDFYTLCAIAEHFKLSVDSLPWYINDAVMFSDSVEFVRQIVNRIPGIISYTDLWLNKAIRLNHRPLFDYLYNETFKLQYKAWRCKLEDEIKWAFSAIASRGWEDLFKELYSKHPQWLDVKRCLEEAAKHGRINILKYLLFHADLAEKARPHINRAFEAAIGNGNIDAIDFLLGNEESGHLIIPCLPLIQPSPNIIKRVGASGRWDGIAHLMHLKTKGDARFANFELAGDACKAVKTACRYGNLRVLTQLLQQDSQGQFVFTFDDPTKLLQESLHQACYRGHLPIVQELLKYTTVNPAANDHETLITACTKGNHLVVRELLRDKRIDAGARDGIPLIKACKEGNLLVVRELLQMDGDGEHIYNVNPAAKDNKALNVACETGHLLIVRELLQHKSVDAGANNNMALRKACKFGHLLIVRELLQKNDSGGYIYRVDPAAKDNGALITACGKGHLLVVRELLQHETVDPSARDNYALSKACLGGHLSVVRELLQRDGSGKYIYNVDPAANCNQPLEVAHQMSYEPIVKELLLHPSVNAAVELNE